MANAQFKELTYFTKRLVGKVQTAETVRISAAGDIAKVLSTGVTAYVNSYETNFGETSFLGKMTIKMLYGDGVTVAGATYNADFSDRISSDLLTQDSQLVFDVSVVEVRAETNANTANVYVVLETTVWAYVGSSTTALVGGEDMFCQTVPAEILTGAKTFKLAFALDEELSAKKPIDTVLLVESAVCLTDVNRTVDVLSVSGDCVVRLTYLSSGKITTDTLPFRFDREIDASSVNADGQLFFTANVRNTKVRLDVSEDNNTNFSVEIVGTLDGEWLGVENVDLVVDAYGENCDFTFSRSKIVTTLPCGTYSAKRKICATVENLTDGEYLTTVNTGASVVEVKNADGKAVIGGIVYGSALTGGDSDVSSTALELPFSQTFDTDFGTNGMLFATATVLDLSAKQGDGTDFDAEICFQTVCHNDAEYTVITEMTQTDFDKSSLPAIEVCVAKKGETTWNLAKSLHMSEEDLLATNPELTSPLENDARVVVYNKL